jgi:DNA (cytosine-5)-methyltransferase 1
MDRQLTKLSLFSGIGGDDLASDWAGIKTIAFVEKDEFCQKVLKKHWPDIPIIGDVHNVTRESIRTTIDIIGGGFPCQPFSTAGKRRGSEDDRYLWPEMLRIIQETKPTWVVGENVSGIISLALNQVLSELENIGYEAIPFVIPACAVNAMHRRDRVFIVAHCKGIYGEQCNKKIRESRRLVESGRYLESLAFPTDYGTIHGIPSELDLCRLKALGNAVVPQQIYPIYKAIATIESELS